MDQILVYLIPITIGVWLGYLITRRKENKITQERIKIMDFETFKQNMRKGQLVDMRKDTAFNQGRIKGARNFRPSYLKHKRQAQVRKDRPVYLYCQNGKKSKFIAKKLLRKGFHYINILDGGYEAYKNSEKH